MPVEQAGGRVGRLRALRSVLLSVGLVRRPGGQSGDGEHTHGSRVLELRVHGVSGTTPAAMLGVPDNAVGQVAGDKVTGLFRAKPGVDLPYRAGRTPRVVVEAYSWGGLTSGATGFLGWLRRAAWLTLLPFALANLAYWARPELDFRRLAPGAGRARSDAIDDPETVYDRHLLWRARNGAWFVRLGGLLLTVLIVVSACTIAFDTVAWQCFGTASGNAGGAPTTGCTAIPSFAADRLAAWGVADRLAAVSLLVALALLLVWFLSHKSLSTYESVNEKQLPSTAYPLLRHRWMWSGKNRTARLQRAHLAVGFTVTVAYGTLPLISTSHGDTVVPGDSHGWYWGLVIAAGAIGGLAALWCLFIHPDDVEALTDNEKTASTPQTPVHPRPYDDTDGRVPWFHSTGPGNLLLTASVVLFGVYLARLHWGPPGDTTPRYVGAHLYGVNVWFVAVLLGLSFVTFGLFGFSVLGTKRGWALAVLGTLLLAASSTYWWKHTSWVADKPYARQAPHAAVLALVVLLAAVEVWNMYRTRVRSNLNDRERIVAARAFGGGGSAVMFLTAVWVALLFSVTAVIGAAKYLLGRKPVTQLEQPQVLVWASMGMLIWVALALVIIVASWLRQRSLASLASSQLLIDGLDGRERDACSSTRRYAAFTRRAESALNWIGYMTPFVAALIIVGAETGESPKDLPRIGGTGAALSNVGLWVTGLLATALVALAAREKHSVGTRKTIGILWDLTTYWPRTVHPFAPPCYAERVEPEVIIRTRWALGCTADPTRSTARTPATGSSDEGHGDGIIVLLSGHSQGSTIVAAAAARLPACCLRHVRLVTYGCQLRALYGRIFPAVFGPEHLGNVATEAPPRFSRPGIDVVALALPPASTGRGNAGTTVSGWPHTPPDGSLLARLTHAHAVPTAAATQPPKDLGWASGLVWVNLFRRTDPIGFHALGDYEVRRVGPVTYATSPQALPLAAGTPPAPPLSAVTAHDVAIDLYVPEVPPDDAGDPSPVVETHSNYQQTPGYIDQVYAWAATVSAPHAATRIDDVPFLPGQ